MSNAFRVTGFLLLLTLMCLAKVGADARHAAGRQQRLQDSLVGTWRLVEYANKLDASGAFSVDGKWTFPYGEQPAGYFVYDPTGHLSIQIMRTPPPKAYASGNDATPTIDELKTVYEGYVAYFGRYSVDEANRSLVHHIEGSLQPSYIGMDQRRPFELSGDRLIIGDQQTWRRVLERVR